MRMGILLTIAILAVTPQETEAAFRDRARFDAQTQSGLVYLSLSDVPAKDREQLAKAAAFVVPSLSSKPNLLQQLPVRVEGTDLLRLDLNELGWSGHYQTAVIKNYPLRPDVTAQGSFPLVISALWFVAQGTDPGETNGMYYELLYSGKPPKTLAEFHAFWKVQRETTDFIGFIEGRSGVAVQKHRLLENHPSGNRGYSWSTYDSAKITGDKDPLENLVPGSIKFDAGEHIVGIPKRASGASGTLQAYFLADKDGKRQEVAPASIVTDHLETRTSEIRNFVSCIGCHTTGINQPTLNEYAAYITAGAKIYVKDRPKKEAIETYLQSDLAKEITRANEDYAASVELANGLKPAENAANYVRWVKYYDADVDQAKAAQELGVDEKTLALALAYYSAGQQPIPARLAALAHGQPMPRKRWEAEYYPASVMVQNFQKDK